MTLGAWLAKELEAEATANRKCLERIPADKADWKPHEKSMPLGYLALLVAEVPRWITATVEPGEINFATWKHAAPKTGAELVAHFDENLAEAKKALEGATDAELGEMFHLKMGDKVMMSMPKGDSVSQSINHMVHHRGQLTVYLRLLDIPVPSIYGPSADDKSF